MGSSEGEAIAVPAMGGNGGGSVCRALSGGREATFTASLPGGCNGQRQRRRERQLESVAFIGQGADANVYLVRCKLTGRMSALKVQQKADHERSVERVQMERELMVDARHPLVAPLYAAFQDRLYLYLEMEYCPGGSLDNFLRLFVKRNLTEDEARFYAAEITLGLEFLHSKGYVYRDLKAANVLVAASGHIKLTDFGIAERGKLRIEVDDKAWKEATSPPRPLTRVKSTPVLPIKATALDVPGTAPAARSRPSPTKAAAGVVVGHSSIHGQRPRTPAGVTETPPRAAPGVHRRASSIPCVALVAGSSLPSPVDSSGCSPSPSGSPSSSSSDAPPTPQTLPTTTAAAAPVSRGGWSAPSFLRRKHQQQQQQQQRQHPSPLVPGETPPRAPPPSVGLGRRMRGRFSRSSRAPSPAGSPWQLSCPSSSPSLSPELAVSGSSSDSPSSPSSSSSSGTSVSPGAAISVRSRPTAAAGRGVGGSGRGVPPPFSGCRGTPSSRDGGRENQGKRHAGTRRATVTLGEASWGLLSGSPEYMAPEVLMHDPQGSAVDWWGLGVLTYELLLGRTPFAGENGKNRLTFLNIMNKEASFPEPGGRRSSSGRGSNGGAGGPDEGVSDVCQQFIRALLSKDPKGRAGSTFPVREHPFFAGVRWDRLLVEEPPLRVPGCSPPRGGSAASMGGGVAMARPPTPPPVDNTSGWWWDPEDAIDIEEDEAAGEGRRKGGEGGGRAEGEGNDWWPFDSFDWSDGEREGGMCSPLGALGRGGEAAPRCGSGNSSGGGKY